MSGFFITGTGTDVGKTFITCLLARQLRAQGQTPRVLKPVISGFTSTQSDAHSILQALGHVPDIKSIDAISPWRFAASVSPDIAASREGRCVGAREIAAFCHGKEDENTLLVEAAGGVMTPLNASETMRDLAEELAYPVILVAGSYLGAISHALTAMEALMCKNLAVRAIILNGSEAAPMTLEDTHASLAQKLPQDLPIALLPRLASGDAAWENAPNLTHLLEATDR